MIISIILLVVCVALLGLLGYAYIGKWREAEIAKADAYKASTELYINNRTISLEIQAARAEAQLYGFQRFFTEYGELSASPYLYKDQESRANKLNRELAIGQEERKGLVQRNQKLIEAANDLTLELNALRRKGSIQTPSKVYQDSIPDSSEFDQNPIPTPSQIDPGSIQDEIQKVFPMRRKENWDIDILESNGDWHLRKKKPGGEWLGEIELVHYLAKDPQATFHITSLKRGEFMPLTDHAGVLLCSAPACNNLVAGDMRKKAAEVCSNACRRELDKYKLKIANQ